MLQLLIICFHPSVPDSNSQELSLKISLESFFHHGKISSVGGALDRLQNSLFFRVFKYAWTVKQNVWNEAENSLSPDTPVGRSRLAVLQSTRLTADRKVLDSIPKANTTGLEITENKGAAYLACKQLTGPLRGSDDHMRSGGPISSSLRRRKDHVLN